MTAKGPNTSIIYQNAEQTVTVIDIPRSIELAQDFKSDRRRRLFSSSPIRKPWSGIPEPKSQKSLAQQQPRSIQELVLQRHLELAQIEVNKNQKSKWLFPRITLQPQEIESLNSNSRKRSIEVRQDPTEHEEKLCISSPYQAFMPPKSTYIQGSIDETLSTFEESAPQFNFVIMDPPWPNRSARRNGSYETIRDVSGTSALLSSLPMGSHLAEDGLVGVWITNKPVFRDLMLKGGGIFEQWGVVFEEEWVWLKVTTEGEPIFPLESRWRKPYEILLIGRKKTTLSDMENMKRRVILAVPDLHSRKPNLKELMEPMLPNKYEALEIFARNLTAGWWAWGQEVLYFQNKESWVEMNDEPLSNLETRHLHTQSLSKTP